MKYQSLKGFRDIFGEDAKTFTFIENAAKSVLGKYNYREIRVPTVESAELFLRSIGETTDIVEKEMYVFNDKGDRKIALRPEGTAGVVRAYVENNLSQKCPSQKFFYIGQMFRQERPQAGRLREFYQIGCEYFGNDSVYADMEVILIAKEILEKIGIKNIKIEINLLGCEKCRPAFANSVKDILKKEFNGLCDDCKKRSEKNPLRALDCKIDREKFSNIEPALCENCKIELEKIKTGLKNSNVDFTISNKLVRGLDYYTKTVFEITSDVLGSQNAVCAGGRYDNLTKELGGPSMPAVGFAIGVDRLVEIINKSESLKIEVVNPDIFVIAIGSEESLKCGFDILTKIRNTGLFSDGGYFTKSLKSQMRLADALNSRFVVIIGDDEIKKNIVVLRDMKTKEQKEVSIEKIIGEVKNVTG
ncbi:MAG: histidine--tRNA ligase [Elusimicrobia bacterium]|nr:histidine--tRNA ligase [Elusimicrobiota bacterium]